MSGLLDQLQFLRPQWLWLLAAVPLLIWWWRTRRRARSAWSDSVDPHLLPHLLGSPGTGRAALAPALALVAFALSVLALAGPSWRSGTQPLWERSMPLVIAVDLSSATLADDLPPSRLLRARAKIEALLGARAGGQVGLVAFADDAFTVAPLTADAANVALFVDALAPDIMPVDGHRPARAIEWSARLLRQAGFDRGQILLLTGTADAAARRAAAAVAADGYRVSVLGLGSASGGSYRDAAGRAREARLDEAALRALAAAGSGTYAEIAAGEQDLRALGVLDATSAAAAGTARGGRAGVRLDEGYWLLLPLLLLAALAFRRGGMLGAVLLCLWLPLGPARAQAPAEREAAERPPVQSRSAEGAVEGGLWRRADQVAHARMQRAVEAFRRGDFAAAERVWGELPGPAAAYNRGNALAKAGRYEEAIAAYDRALALQPGMEDAVANRAAVEAAMQRQPPAGPRADAAGDPREGESPQAPGEGAPPPPEAQRGGDRPGQQQARDDAQPEPPPPQPADARAQQDADAAQRERMRRQLQAEEAGDEGRSAADPSETRAERELREANEAWLRRVPDDPGGLLRAKFQLEHERRRRDGAD
ncbi:tetratricopeptide repeat protein [Luteimonas sp. RD2P54]|uniref:Tetratricopeptide repeat protein n=1 Tax=Luteimonas endophytica TaxID=3042023 RepID=A0ABT6J7U0_9GAMM|nr:tetratricopeptide repeat protein [Luteimonas endophytica]MDH5822888.1 tetratricopeptide repeat protein [Luteimonas endophytica]